MKKLVFVALSAILLTGCASQQYDSYLNSQAQIETAKANAEAERYRAMAEIAKYGDTTTQVAAMMALQNRDTNIQTTKLQAPVSPSEEIRRWASIIVPGAVQIYSTVANSDVAINNSNNNRDVSIANAEQRTASTSAIVSGMANIAGEIQAPAANYSYTDSYNQYADSYNTPTDSYNVPADSYNTYDTSYNTDDNSDNSNNSDNSTDNSVTQP